MLFRQMCCHMVGEEEAIRVMSLNPPAASCFISSSFVSVSRTRHTRLAAMMWGRWLMVPVI